MFVNKALEVGTQNSATLSASLLEEMRQEAPLFETVALIQLAVDPLQKQIDDTVLQSSICGSAPKERRRGLRQAVRPQDAGRPAIAEPPSSTPPGPSLTTSA